MDAIWIDRHKEAEAESNGYVVVEPESVLATHISQIMYKFAHILYITTPPPKVERGGGDQFWGKSKLMKKG